MFSDKSSGKFVPPNGLSARALNASNAAAQAAQAAALSAAASGQQAAQSAAQNVAPVAQSAAENLGSASRNAAQGMGRSLRQGVYSARGWAAPRLDTAADYWTDSAAPRVSAALHTTARRVDPDDGGSRSVLKAILLSIAGLAGAGAVAMLIQRQLGKSTVRKESDVVDAGDDSGKPTAPGQTTAPAEAASADLNGQTSASRR